MSPSIEELGGLRWQLVICHIVAWIIVALSLIKGVKSSGKVVRFSIVLPHENSLLASFFTHPFLLNLRFLSNSMRSGEGEYFGEAHRRVYVVPVLLDRTPPDASTKHALSIRPVGRPAC